MSFAAKRSLLLTFILLLLSSGSILLDSGSVVGLLVQSFSGVGGSMVGLAIASIMIARHPASERQPRVWVVFAIVGLLLYLLFRTVLLQLDGVDFPAYFPAEWVAVICSGVLGLLMGAGIPLMLYALVVTGYQLLE